MRFSPKFITRSRRVARPSFPTATRGRKQLYEGVGFLLGCLGTMLGTIDAVGSEPTFLGLTSIGSWW